MERAKACLPLTRPPRSPMIRLAFSRKPCRVQGRQEGSPVGRSVDGKGLQGTCDIRQARRLSHAGSGPLQAEPGPAPGRGHRLLYPAVHHPHADPHPDRAFALHGPGAAHRDHVDLPGARCARLCGGPDRAGPGVYPVPRRDRHGGYPDPAVFQLHRLHGSRKRHLGHLPSREGPSPPLPDIEHHPLPVHPAHHAGRAVPVIHRGSAGTAGKHEAGCVRAQVRAGVYLRRGGLRAGAHRGGAS